VVQPPDQLFVLHPGDTVDVTGGILTFVTSDGAFGTFSNAPLKAARVLSSLAAVRRVQAGGTDSSFLVDQSTPGVTNLTLTGGDFSSCSAKRRVSADDKRTVRQLWGHAKGSFRTTAKHSSATIRGTTWGVQDRCDGTLTTALDDPVDVFDLAKKKTVTLTAGQTYLAKPADKPFQPPAQKPVTLPALPRGQTAATVAKNGLRWRGWTFKTKSALSVWLDANGSSWQAFVKAHPAIAAALAKRSRA
jgi:hypothetical protein